MTFVQLMGRYQRLKRDLATAYNARPWHSAHINRLADDLLAIERELQEMALLSVEGGTLAREAPRLACLTSRELGEEIARME